MIELIDAIKSLVNNFIGVYTNVYIIEQAHYIQTSLIPIEKPNSYTNEEWDKLIKKKELCLIVSIDIINGEDYGGLVQLETVIEYNNKRYSNFTDLKIN